MRASWIGLSCLGLALFACGGRTLEDGVYGVDGAAAASCTYAGTEYENGKPINEGACFCFCNEGRIECDPNCSSSSGGASTGGSYSTGATSSSGGNGNASSGGATTTGGTSSTAGTSSGGYGAGGVSTGGGVGIGGSSSTGGSSATGGSSTGGSVGSISSCGPTPRATGMNPLIDDMEDGDAYILANDGRSGVWYTYNDGTGGYQFPVESPFAMLKTSDATGGSFVADTYGQGFASWGAGMGFVLNNGCPYNASRYQGLHFYARSQEGPIYVMLPTVATTPVSNRGTCLEVSSNSCYDDYQTTIKPGPDWQEVRVPFSVLSQQGWGTAVTFDATTLVGVNFQTLYAGGAFFSFSIDSISFY